VPQRLTNPGWSRIEIGGKPADVFEPTDGPALRLSLLWLHSQDEASPANNAALTARLNSRRLPCVAPFTGRSWWVDRIGSEFDATLTAERHVIANVLPWMKERWAGIGVAGIEMGGQGAVRLALKHPKLFPVAAGLGSALDFHELHGRGTPLDAMYDSRERARQDTATLYMHATDWPPHLWFACDPEDPWYRGNDRLHEKLSAYGVPHTADLESSGSDYFEAMLEPMLDFIVTGLQRESRRLVVTGHSDLRGLVL